MTKAQFLIRTAVLLTFTCPFVQPQTSPQLLVGFVDDAREQMADWKVGVASDRVVRPAFLKSGSGWQSVACSAQEPLTLPKQKHEEAPKAGTQVIRIEELPTCPANGLANGTAIADHISWTIAFDGKRLGVIESQNSDKRPTGYALTPMQRIVKGTAPEIGEPSRKFAGLMAMGETKVRRPLVVVSKPYFADPDGWKRLQDLPEQIKQRVRAAFRRDFPHVDRCGTEENVLEHNWKFPDSALSFPSLYGSNKRSFLVEAHLNAGDCGYIDDPNDPLASPWFFVTPEGAARRIGAFMTVLDAGDYDNDGKSEIIFFLSQPEDTDGFVLFDSDLRKRASLVWTYH